MPIITSIKTRRNRRRGAIESIELLLALPILLVLALGVIHFGLLVSNTEHVAFASRVGALAASQAGQDEYSDQDVPDRITEAVAGQLLINGIDHYAIHLEYNVGAGRQTESKSVGEIECDAPELLETPPSRDYVRVTVCVRMDELTPNLLPTFGMDIGGDETVVQHTTIMRYELSSSQ